MKIIVRKSILFILLVDAALCFSQTGPADTIHHLKEAEVTANRLTNFSSGNKIQEIDSAALSQHSTSTLADLLVDQSQVFIKSYGMGSLASPSMRGSGAGHTAVLWNGFNLTSPMYGQLDFALVPVNFLNSIKLQYGGSGALWGSGAVGGTIHLNNIPEFDKGISAGATVGYGSFDDRQQSAEFSVSNKKFISSTKIFNHDAANDFSFINTAQFGMPEQKLANAELKQYGLLQENYFKIKEGQKLSFRLWYQFNDRNIPASMTVGTSKANQKDEFYRGTLNWQLTKEKISVFVRTAYFGELLIYNDPLISLKSNSHSKSFISEAESKIRISVCQFINIGVNNTYYEGVSKNIDNVNTPYNYIKNPFQNRTSFFSSYRINNKKDTWKGTATVRQELVSTGQEPLTGSAGFEGWLFKEIRLRGSTSKNYRLPDFNDLYWTPGGNPNLLPENGMSEELGLAFIHCTDNFSVEAEVTGFSNKVDNWIMWLPNNYGIPTAKNVLSVWARGSEYDLKLYYTINKVKLNLTANYQFILSTNEKVSAGAEASLNKQLIYAPAEKAIISTGIEYKGFGFSFSYNYVGYRYTSADNYLYLEPYHLYNADLNKTFTFSHLKLKIFLRVNNIMDRSYQAIAYYAMPGRYYHGGLSINFNKLNKNPNKNDEH